jgi:hypothetical protein
MSISNLPSKNANDVEPFFIVWCDKDGTNDGTTTDEGELQGATISASSWVVPTGITADSDNTDAVSIAGVSYAINTVATVVLSGGTPNTTYRLTNRITTSDGRQLSKAIDIKVDVS